MLFASIVVSDIFYRLCIVAKPTYGQHQVPIILHICGILYEKHYNSYLALWHIDYSSDFKTMYRGF